MKFRKSAAAALIAAALTMTAAFPAGAATVNELPAAVTVSDSTEDIPHIKTEAEAEKYFIQQFKAHTEHIEFFITEPEDNDYKRINDRIFAPLDHYNGKADEGFYLSMEATRSSSALPTKDGIRVICDSTFITTPEQETQVTEEMEKLRSTDGFQAACSASIYDRILWAYDYVSENMVLTDDLSDQSHSSAYSALINGEANEQGQIHLLIRLLGELGVACAPYATNLNSLTNDSLDAHFMAMAEIDGKNYFLDPVWDKKLEDTGHNFFLKGYNDLDSENGGREDLTHIHLFQIFSFGEEVPLEESMKELGVAPSAYPGSEYPLGDVNADGFINSVDASNVLAEYARLSTGDRIGYFKDSRKKAADVNKDGSTDAVDASQILSYYAYAATAHGESMSIEEYLS
ncbi:dockerin type I domain-containing protein [Ruminococcus flavefaciens]|uniref:dockerin type I domain-containing protein n=1 Tax=Ruminococcus flavefaciens TaxID=1265 RepID=UPI000491690C|nr:dockerin type I domain-containing protein [Ruminococcus flavefaciens]